MQVITHSKVLSFIDKLDSRTYASVLRTLSLLEVQGHELGMPFAKPIGKGLFELRVHNAAAVRFLYGFNNEAACIVVAFKKERSSIRPQDIKLAQQRLAEYCA